MFFLNLEKKRKIRILEHWWTVMKMGYDTKIEKLR